MAGQNCGNADRTAMVIRRIRHEARRVISLTLVDPGGRPVPKWEPGAHIDLLLPSGTVRQYSLCGDPAETAALTIAVRHEPDGRGGSHELHTIAAVGTQLHIRAPRNQFSLTQASNHLLIAGGIGVTPILPMARELERRQQGWHAVYCGRHDTMPFVDELRATDPRRVTIRATDHHGRPDLAAMIADLPHGAAVYCCGPPTLIAEVTTCCARRTDLILHTERFTADPTAPASNRDRDRDIDLELAMSGTKITVPAGQTILEAIRKIRPDIPFSCTEGYCGTCETRVLDGIPEHHDTVLDTTERAANKKMMICVSRARTQHLTLDL